MTTYQHPFAKRDHGAFVATSLLLLAAIPAVIIVMLALYTPPLSKTEANILDLIRLSRAFNEQIQKPDVVRGVYLTSNTAGSDVRRGEIFDLVERTELNAVVIDMKTSKGALAYPVGVQLAQDAGLIATNPYDLDTILTDAHSRGIWVIARLPVFEDPALALARPDLALTTRGGGFWLTNRGVAWVDTTNKEVWKYASDLVNDALARGFDEVQLDYVRFPSDGALADTVYDNWSADGSQTKYEIIEEFFAYIRERSPKGDISADLFGLTMDASSTATIDLSIGQRLRDGLAHFTVISPMIYPSHYGAFYAGYQSPASAPGPVIAQTMDAALPYLETMGYAEGESLYSQIRPWLQDFNLGAIYTPAMVRAQIDEVEARGAEGWLLWNPRNTYTEEALKPAN